MNVHVKTDVQKASKTMEKLLRLRSLNPLCYPGYTVVVICLVLIGCLLLKGISWGFGKNLNKLEGSISIIFYVQL